MEKPYRPSTSELLRTSFALDRTTAGMVNTLKKEHGAKNVTLYIRGLICLDWLEKKGPLDINVVPPWIIVAYRLDVVAGQVQPPRKK